MIYKTYLELKTKVEQDLGLEQEEFIRPSEMLDYANEAIEKIESEIHGIYEDYFLTNATISLVQGRVKYSLPSNIYANKIRAVIYQNGSEIYKVERIKELYKFIDIMLTNVEASEADYRYITINESASAGITLNLVPPARESITDALTIWYLREANRMVDDDSICDIPQFYTFVIQWMKMRCYEKQGDPRFQVAAALAETLKNDTIATLSDKNPDGDTEIEMDLSHYNNSI